MNAIANAEPLRIIIDQEPSTLNPRHSIDAAGQRLGALLFRSLTHIDKNLEPIPDLATSWTFSKDAKHWEFNFVKNATDHKGVAITPERYLECVKSYIEGTPHSSLGGEFKHIQKYGFKNGRLYFDLIHPDPYFIRNITLLRYFRTSKGLCIEDESGSFIGSGSYELSSPNFIIHEKISLHSVKEPEREIQIEIVKDENTRALKLLREDSDALQNAMSLSKEKWFMNQHQDQFKTIERDSVLVTYLAFNLKDPILKDLRVRRALALSIDREKFVREKLFGMGSVAGSLLSPLLPESYSVPFQHDVNAANKLLEEAGYKANSKGIRIQLHYKTTPAREGIEVGLIFKEMMKAIGVDLILDVVEPAVFFSSTRKGHYQLYSSRWVGVADASILARTLKKGEPMNRTHYENPEVEMLLEKMTETADLEKRRPYLNQIQAHIFSDLPYFPLWFWKNVVIVNKKRAGKLESSDLSLSGALDPLVEVR